MVKAKKHLGQHFLLDEGVSSAIVKLLQCDKAQHVLEIGPGTGVLTKYLLKREGVETHVAELDRESVAYLKQHFPDLTPRIHEGDFLRMDLAAIAPKLCIIGNFPYNISSQILFAVLDNRDMVPEVVGMFQKEVAQRVASPPGSKAYGILSVLLQAYYDIEFHITVPPDAFDPPPKVESGVIRLQRNDVQSLDCDEALFKTVIKTAFNQRRKTLRNSLRSLLGDKELPESLVMRRPEQLSVQEFIELTQLIDS